MKKYIFTLYLLISLSAVCIGQEEQENIRKGTVRFNPADLFVNLHNALPGMYVTWTPYILPNLGVPAEIDVNVGWGVLPGVQVSFLSGVEYILPIRPTSKEKNGLFLDAKIGLSLFIHEGTKASFVTKANVGYQFVTKKGFVYTPAAGAVYNGRTGLGLNIMLDIGFAYKNIKI